MSRETSFRVLGPLSVTVGRKNVSLPSGRQRSLLAALLVHPGGIVPVEKLVDLVWGDELPHSPRPALHTLLTRLRQSLDAGGAGLSGLLRTSPSGYLIEVPAGCLDLTLFRESATRARLAAELGDRAQEHTALTEALALWRGQPLGGVRSDALHRDVVPGLMEEWIRAMERYHDVCLALGRHDEIVGDLRTLTAKYPLRESLWQRLMLALYRCGRRGEALAAYAEVSGFFRDELGVDPGRELRHLHVAILRTDVSLSLARSA
ncbi:AfsR/SARP family transcriptional regulator [Streptomyces sp. NPDC021096]|uniref:AfsR/SARP family transcriptional regulator n=1 Tax=Streptomyces sp. NPDC021096 TaxID=3154792 RepID=UPI0033F574E7